MKITFTPEIQKMRGMHGGRNSSDHGFSMRPTGSQVFNLRTRKSKKPSFREIAGENAMKTLMHAFSNLTTEQRQSVTDLRLLIRREWQTNQLLGKEETDVPEITYSDLDFFISCNHHRILANQPPTLNFLPDSSRPSLQIFSAERWQGNPHSVLLRFTDNIPPDYTVSIWVQAGIPFRSEQRFWRENDYYALAVPLTDSWRESTTPFANQLFLHNTYPLSIGQRCSFRALRFNQQGVPYGYTTWIGNLD